MPGKLVHRALQTEGKHNNEWIIAFQSVTPVATVLQQGVRKIRSVYNGKFVMVVCEPRLFHQRRPHFSIFQCLASVCELCKLAVGSANVGRHPHIEFNRTE